MEKPATRDLDSHPILEVGLLLELCGIGVGETGSPADLSPESVLTLSGQSARLMQQPQIHADRHLEVVQRLLSKLLAPTA